LIDESIAIVIDPIVTLSTICILRRTILVPKIFSAVRCVTATDRLFTSVSKPISIAVELIEIRGIWTIVTDITSAVAIAVILRRIGDELTVIGGVKHSITIAVLFNQWAGVTYAITITVCLVYV
jgi:hypothetical protein